MAIPDSHKSVIESYIDDNETPLAAHADENETLVATEDRLLSVATDDRGPRETREVESILFDNIAAVQTERVGEEPLNLFNIAVSGLISLLGFIVIGFGLINLSGGGQVITITVGVVGAVIGASALYRELQQGDGFVTLTIHSANDGLTREYQLPKESVDVAHTVSQNAR